MKSFVVRTASLYVFNIAVLLVVGMVLPAVFVSWHAIWAAVILTAASLAIKPILTRAFRSTAARSAGSRSRGTEKLVQYGIVFAVELIIWIATVWFSGVRVSGFFWGYVIPPILLLIGWVIYDQIVDRVEATAGQLYDRIGGTPNTPTDAAPPTNPAATREGRAELNDGLTAEQRRLLDELG